MPPKLDQLTIVIPRKALTRPCSCSFRTSFLTSTSRYRVLPQPFQRPPPSHTSTRTLTTSPALLKHGGKQESKRNVTLATERTKDVDPFDFSELESGIQKALERLKDELGKLRAGGRFNPEVVEALRVELRNGEAKETVRLRDLAQVLPRGGRTVVVLVGEGEHTQPIKSTILSSPHSLNPIPSPTNPLELHIAIPPPTKESRLQALATASKAGEAAAHAVRQARGAQQKKLRAMGIARTVGPDDLRRAGERMEKVVEKGAAEVKKVVEGARRVLEQG